MSDRYIEVVRGLFDELVVNELAGMGVVVSAARQQGEVASALASSYGWPCLELSEDVVAGAWRFAVAVLPDDDERAAAALRTLNEARQRVSAAGRMIALVVSRTQVLVERWNRVRSLSGVGATVPIKTADAVRLLGPVALHMVRSGTRGAIPERALLDLMEETLASGRLRSIGSAAQALDLFRRTLGLLVEQGPGVYAFLHLTLAEYLAARELVRTGELEDLVQDRTRAFAAEWREIILLAAGELGILRADDAHLEAMLEALLATTARLVGRPSPTVPSLLAGLLLDDPGLSRASADALVDALIPTWWFERRYWEGSLLDVLSTALVHELRLLDGRFAPTIRARLAACFARGASEAVLANLDRRPPGYDWSSGYSYLLVILTIAKIDNGPLFLQSCARGRGAGLWGVMLAAANRRTGEPQLFVSRSIVEAVQANQLALTLVATPYELLPVAEDPAIAPSWSSVDLDANPNPYVYVPCTIERPLDAWPKVSVWVTDYELHPA